ncbi:helix-turn-helix transcriptional regulator [Starkeya sp. ORNL1]|nr:helix-turn-helix transcriptional regulator [Starkeya sp. ORNL1]
MPPNIDVLRQRRKAAGAPTFSMIAERAGVQRHTLYAHFPDERSLNRACPALVVERAGAPQPRDVGAPSR